MRKLLEYSHGPRTALRFVRGIGSMHEKIVLLFYKISIMGLVIFMKNVINGNKVDVENIKNIKDDLINKI